MIIFVLGHAISIILTPFANYAADMYGRRLIVCLALALYSLSSLLKVVNDYSTLLISSILASCASLLVKKFPKTKEKTIIIRYFHHLKDGTHTSTSKATIFQWSGYQIRSKKCPSGRELFQFSLESFHTFLPIYFRSTLLRLFWPRFL